MTEIKHNFIVVFEVSLLIFPYRGQRNGGRDRDREGKDMSFGHKKLDVYRISLTYVSWVYELFDKLNGKHRFSRDQLLRASQSIPLNIAEGNGKFSEADRKRFFGIARGSALECAAIQDVLIIGKAITKEEYDFGEELLVRIVSMLSKMAKKSWSVKEESTQYGDEYDHDHDHDEK